MRTKSIMGALVVTLGLTLAFTGCKASQLMTDEQTQELAQIDRDIETALAAGEAAAVAALEEDRDALIDESLATPIQFVSRIVTSAIPAAAPFAGLIDMLSLPLVGLLFKRPRQRLTSVYEDVKQGKILDAARDVGAYLGFKHSSDDPREVLRGARAAALERGDTATVSAIDKLLATLPVTS